MRFLLLFVAGCGFKGADVVTATGDGPERPIDAPMQVSDAPNEMIDAAIGVDAKLPPADAFTDPTWPCGVKPPPPADPMAFGDATTSLKVSATLLDGSRLALGAPGDKLDISFSWFIHDAACTQCRDQIEYGWVDTNNQGMRRGCVFDGFMALPSHTRSDDFDGTITIPSTPGQYQLRFALTEQDFCGGSDWAEGQPPASHAIAIVCVH